jgi:hypothetical protein
MMFLTAISKQVIIGGHVFTVTALPLGVLKREVPKAVKGLNVADVNILDSQLVDSMLDIVRLSLSRAEPELTQAELEDNLILADVLQLFQEVLAVSGYTREGNDTGEAIGQGMLSPSGGQYMGA